MKGAEWQQVDGRVVDELDHALQAAHNALVDCADDELVLASALHDLARSPLGTVTLIEK